jgi:hypothetical protein
MDKQKKQLIILLVLVIAAGGVALWQFVLKGDGKTSAPATTDPKAATPAPQPKGGTPGTAKGPTQPANTAPVTVVEDLPIPLDEKPRERRFQWPVQGGGKKTEKGAWPFDPLFVMNLDVVNPEMRKEIDALRTDWVPDGITITTQRVRVENVKRNEAGVVIAIEQHWEEKPVIECWFQGERAPFKVDDRLTGTRYTIEEIIFGKEIWRSEREPLNDKDETAGEVRRLTRKPYTGPDAGTEKAIVRLRGDKGNLLDMEVAPASRYGEKATTKRK